MLIDTTYFYAPPDAFRRGNISFSEEETHHLATVLRIREGDEFFVTDGFGKLFRCRLEKGRSEYASASIISEEESISQPTIRICLAMGILKNKQMEIALDWSTQLGIVEFVPLLANFSEHEMGTEGAYLERFQKIAIRAIKQSKSVWLPEISEKSSLAEFLKFRAKDFDGLLYADISGVPSLPKRMAVPETKLAIIIGPEGGLSSAEQAELTEYGAIPFSLGHARLRSETAAVLAVAKVLALSGNL